MGRTKYLETFSLPMEERMIIDKPKKKNMLSILYVFKQLSIVVLPGFFLLFPSMFHCLLQEIQDTRKKKKG